FLPPHNHPSAAVCTLGFEGVVQLRNFEIVGEAPCVGIRTESAFQFELGFDEESVRKTYIVSGVKPASEAFKSGIRNGQKITRVSVSWNDTSKPVKLTIRAADGDHTYEYYPRGGLREIQQYYIQTDCS